MSEWEPLGDDHEINKEGFIRRRSSTREPRPIQPVRDQSDKLRDYRDRYGDRGHGDDGLEPRTP